MAQASISKASFQFFEKLAKNNNREWFNAHKATYILHKENSRVFFEHILQDLQKHDEIEKLKIFRIYRDVRFAKDKKPYKTHFAASYARAGARLRGGYYLHLQPGGSFMATGFWKPNKEDLFRIRKEMENNAQEARTIINGKQLQEFWGSLKGEELKTAPKGFDKEHPDIDLIRKKQYLFIKQFTDEEVLAADFMEKIDAGFISIRPFLDWMSDVLTTDLNGESLLQD